MLYIFYSISEFMFYLFKGQLFPFVALGELGSPPVKSLKGQLLQAAMLSQGKEI